MASDNEIEIPTLKQNDALALWRQGKDAWNKWVEQNPECNIDFSGVDFSNERKVNCCGVDFIGFNFPLGEVSFLEANFGNDGVIFSNAKFKGGNVNYSRARFGGGGVYFSDTKFDNGDVSFIETQFGDGDVNFSGVKFGKGDISFERALFGEGDVSFDRAFFGEGDVSFARVSFGEGDVSFVWALFGEGHVDFSEAKLGEGDTFFHDAEFSNGSVSFVGTEFGKGYIVNFSDTQFGDGNISFSGAKFIEGVVSFSGAEFGEGDVYFNDTYFGETDINFFNAKVRGHFHFGKLIKPHKISQLNFQGTEFCKAFTLSGHTFYCVPDLTETKISHHIALDDVSCSLLVRDTKFCKLWTVKQAVDRKDNHRFRRLKQLAEDNGNHESAIEFHAQELRAKRWQKGTKTLSNLLDLAFDKVSNYGRDAFTPFKWLVRTWILFSVFYYSAAWEIGKNSWRYFGESLAFSAGQLLPIVPGARIAQSEGVKFLFSDNLPVGVIALTFIETLISLVLIFLIGLALRNRFRI